ncbi:MAG: hypothetical protein GTN80_09015 [Nitrososphaeria archaeon]|nr:hypothetical protein [Nitrososphaeria archaeon]NIN53306.1 hypothetical protein [Nitrososphaeria archaeon]NIQ33759.1 hypothetical protein [Nitrososphaeria archaeon]
MIDAHTHMDLRPIEDFELMANAGIGVVVTCSFYLGASSSHTLLDHYNQLIDIYVIRAKENGVKLYVAVGIHPYGIPRDYEEVLKTLSDYLEHEDVVAVGEIGVDSGSKLEFEVFKKQLEIARDQNIPAVIHTPLRNRGELFAKCLETIREVETDPQLLVIDHADEDIVDEILVLGSTPGLTIREKQPSTGRITQEKAASLIKCYGPVFTLNSDINNVFPADPLSVAKMVHHLRQSGFSDEEIEILSDRKAREVLKL